MAQRGSGGISYMGTKHELADDVARVVALCQPGMLLDAFAGMGAVAEAHAANRNVWTNDVQYFAHLASSCRFTDPGQPLSSGDLHRLSRGLFRENMGRLREQNLRAWRATRAMVRTDDFSRFERAFDNAAAEPIRYANAYGCFIRSYANAYFSLVQCAEIDSIRCSIDLLRGRGLLSEEEFRWALLALGRAALRVANTTGHFAQYLTPSPSNYRRVCRQFQRSVYREWLTSVDALGPVGASAWRKNNVSTRAESTSILRSPDFQNKVGVVYCDPPYTDDQYSRFYHVWETLVLYDYPPLTGKGRYRPNRFVTDFSLISRVAEAFREVVTAVATAGADLVLSYPTNGLLHLTGTDPLEILRDTYVDARLVIEKEHSHSTLGASKGPAKAAVAERIYLAIAR